MWGVGCGVSWGCACASSTRDLAAAPFSNHRHCRSLLSRPRRELWLAAAERVFGDLGGAKDGSVATGSLVSALRAKLPAAEVEYAVEDALVEAGLADEEELDFEGFLRVLGGGGSESESSGHDLAQYDARLPRGPDGSVHGRPGSGGAGSMGSGGLAPVAEGG